MIYRWTVWESEAGDALQLSLSVLDANWEPLCDFSKQIGPFNPVEERRLELMDDVRRWLRYSGYQLELLP